MSYALTSPCPKCPFRTDIEGYLRKDRVREIERSLLRAEFHCHLTTRHDDEDELVKTGKEQHCAGALILLEKLRRASQMMRIAERLGLYDAGKLDMDAPIFDTFNEMVRAQAPRRKRA